MFLSFFLTSLFLSFYLSFRNTFPMRVYLIIPVSLGDQREGVRPHLWYVLLVDVVYNGMVQSARSYYRDSRVNHMFRNTFPIREY